MSVLVPYRVGDDTVIYVESDDAPAPAGTGQAGARDRAPGSRTGSRQAGSEEDVPPRSFNKALDSIRPMVSSVLEKLQGLEGAGERLQEMEVEFGISFNSNVGAVLAKAGVDTNFKVTLKWQKAGPGGK